MLFQYSHSLPEQKKSYFAMDGQGSLDPTPNSHQQKRESIFPLFSRLWSGVLSVCIKQSGEDISFKLHWQRDMEYLGQPCGRSKGGGTKEKHAWKSLGILGPLYHLLCSERGFTTFVVLETCALGSHVAFSLFRNSWNKAICILSENSLTPSVNIKRFSLHSISISWNVFLININN